jgi:hypothetical protein
VEKVVDGHYSKWSERASDREREIDREEREERGIKRELERGRVLNVNVTC